MFTSLNQFNVTLNDVMNVSVTVGIPQVLCVYSSQGDVSPKDVMVELVDPPGPYA